MLEFISSWYRRYFTDPQAALLVVLLLLSVVVLLTLGRMLAPFLAALIIAYLLEGAVQKLRALGLARFWRVCLVFLLFLAFMAFLVLFLLPLLSRQLGDFFQEVPAMINNGQDLLLRLPEQYPEFISEDYISQLILAVREGLGQLGQNLLSFSMASIPAIITALIYLILVPLLIFFFLKDKDLILAWFVRFLPRERPLVDQIWREMDAQMGNYVRGKFNEIIIVGGVSYIVFVFLGLNYASLLAMLVGLSVLIPYIGAAVATLPIALVGYFQWGISANFASLMVWYFVIQFLDGNVLVPVLFSEAVNLHPVAIIVAILIFGGLWGFWGVFFAIPLATLVKALINVWPTHDAEPAEAAENA